MSTDARLRSPRLRALIERAAPRALAPPHDAADRCDLCARAIGGAHRHVVDLDARRLLCACRACSLLFDHASAGGGHYRLVPERRVRVRDLRLDDLRWRSLGLPVDMAFFVKSGASDRVTAFYPSPAGATESQLALDSWAQLERDHPGLAAMQPDVEALLVDGTDGTRAAWLVGVDECYRLVALVRRHWQGFGGGEVWTALRRFFDDLDARASDPEAEQQERQ